MTGVRPCVILGRRVEDLLRLAMLALQKEGGGWLKVSTMGYSFWVLVRRLIGLCFDSVKDLPKLICVRSVPLRCDARVLLQGV